jgi:hypothetical protein
MIALWGTKPPRSSTKQHKAAQSNTKQQKATQSNTKQHKATTQETVDGIYKDDSTAANTCAAYSDDGRL